MTAPVLPDDGILLHVGPHKTGTTAIQGALAAARPQLKQAGILYPGRRPEHNRQAAAAIQRTLGWEHRTVDRGQWLDLSRRVGGHAGRSVVSSEVFCEADAAAAARIVADLGPARVRVVVTLRPLEKLLPSNWQQYIKSGYRIGYSEWLDDVLESRDKRPVTPSFWIRNNHPALIRRWCEAVGGPERVLVVVVDPARRRSLFDSFEDVLRLPRNTLGADESGPRNRSLSAPEVELLRQLNRRVRHKIGYDDYYRFVKRGAVRRLVEGRTPGSHEPAVTTPAWALARAREFSKSDVAEIRASGVRVLGDVAALAPATPLPDTSDAEPVTTVPAGLAATFLFSLLETAIDVDAAGRRAAATRPNPVVPAAPPPPETPGLKLDRAIARVRGRIRRDRAGAVRPGRAAGRRER